MRYLNASIKLSQFSGYTFGSIQLDYYSVNIKNIIELKYQTTYTVYVQCMKYIHTVCLTHKPICNKFIFNSKNF